MALTTDGEFLLTVNNAAEPPFATLFNANGDRHFSSVSVVSKITIAGPGIGPSRRSSNRPGSQDQAFLCVGADRRGNRQVAMPGAGQIVTCDGGLLVIDPAANMTATTVLGAFDGKPGL